MAVLKREDILNSSDLKFEDVSVPEWGGEVRVRCLTGTERDNFEAEMFLNRKEGDPAAHLKNLRAKLVFLSAIDEKGDRIFTDPEDITSLGKKNAAPLDRLFDACQKLSGLRKEDVDKMVKN